MSDLWERLKAAQNRTANFSGGRVEDPAKKESEDAPNGWVWKTRLVAERTISFELEPSFWTALERMIDPDAWNGVFCFDTETTGLSGGAGTVAFLIGWASLLPCQGQAPPRAEIRQWFLRDHPGENDLIEIVDSVLAESRGLVSFNGSAFDLPLLKGRWALSGREFPKIPHRDDLHPARRLWKRLLDTCRLARLEEAVLGIHRRDDVPGSFVPALWLDYLHRGAKPDFTAPLGDVLHHHAQDVYSLLCLDMVLEALKNDPVNPRWQGIFGNFPYRASLGNRAAYGLLHPDLGTGTPVDFWGILPFKNETLRQKSLEDAWIAEGSEALGLACAQKWKRQGDAKAYGVWERLWKNQRSFPALEESLKWLEHVEKSVEAKTEALQKVQEALRTPFLPETWKKKLEKRLHRLKKSLNPTVKGP